MVGHVVVVRIMVGVKVGSGLGLVSWSGLTNVGFAGVKWNRLGSGQSFLIATEYTVKKTMNLGGLSTLYSSRFLKKQFFEITEKNCGLLYIFVDIKCTFYTKSLISIIFEYPEQILV